MYIIYTYIFIRDKYASRVTDGSCLCMFVYVCVCIYTYIYIYNIGDVSAPLIQTRQTRERLPPCLPAQSPSLQNLWAWPSAVVSVTMEGPSWSRSKETYYSVKRDLLQCQNKPIIVSKETYYSVSDHGGALLIKVKRDLLQCQNKPIIVSKETSVTMEGPTSSISLFLIYIVMRSPCAGAALDPPLWTIPNKALSLSLSL